MTNILDVEDRRIEGPCPQVPIPILQTLTTACYVAQILREKTGRVIRWLQTTPPLATHNSPWEEDTCERIFTHPSYSARIHSRHSMTGCQ